MRVQDATAASAGFQRFINSSLVRQCPSICRLSLKIREFDERGVVLGVVPRAFVPCPFEKRAGVVPAADGDEMLRKVEAGFAFLALSLLLVGARRRRDHGFAIEPA